MMGNRAGRASMPDPTEGMAARYDIRKSKPIGEWHGPTPMDHFFGWIDEDIRASMLTRTSRHVLGVLCAYANREGIAFPGRDTIAKEVDRSEWTVSQAIAQLVDLSLIERRQQKRKGRWNHNVYKVNILDPKNWWYPVSSAKDRV